MPAGRSRRVAPLLLTVLLGLVAALGVQVAHPPSAAASVGPTAVDDTATVPVGETGVTLAGGTNDIAGDAPLDPEQMTIPGFQFNTTPEDTVTEDGRTAVLAGFGTFHVDDHYGNIYFGSAGNPGTRTIRYAVVDTWGQVAEGTATVTVASAAGDDRVETTPGVAVTTDLLANDAPGRNADGSPGTLDRTSLRFAATQPPDSPGVISSDGLVATVPAVGVFRIDATTRLLTYVPDPGYVSYGLPSGALTYTVRDTTRAADGRTEHHTIAPLVRWFVQRPAAVTVWAEYASPQTYEHVGDTVTWETLLVNTGPVPIEGLALEHRLARRMPADVCSPVALGGTLAPTEWTTCTTTTRVTQEDLDADDDHGQLEDAVTARATARQGGQTLTVRGYGSTSVTRHPTRGLTVTGTTSPATVSTVGQRVDHTFVVTNRGNRSVRDLVVSSSSAGVSALVCSPVALGGTLGDGRSTTCRASRTVTPADLRAPSLRATVKATAAPVSGSRITAVNAAVTVTVPVRGSAPPAAPAPAPGAAPSVRADSARTTTGHPVVVDVLANDAPAASTVPLVGSSVRLRLPASGLPAGSGLYGDAKTLKVAGRGVFLVSGTGQVTFVPLGRATGPVPTVGYQVADASGTTARSTLSVTVA